MNRTTGNLAYKITKSQTKKTRHTILSSEYRKRHSALPERVSIPKQQRSEIVAEKIRREMSRQRAAAVFSVIIVISLVTAAFAGVLVRQARILEMNYANVRLEREIAALSNETGNIREELAKRTDLDQIREIASQRLMLQEPAERQIKKVIIPQNDVLVVHHRTTDDKTVAGDMDDIFRNLEGFFRRIR